MEGTVHLKPESTDLPPNPPHQFGDNLSADIQIQSRGKYRQGARWLMLSGAIAILGIGGWFGYQRFWQPLPPAVSVNLMPAKRGTVELTTSESGVVALDGEQTLKSPEDVTVEQVFVREGDRVLGTTLETWNTVINQPPLSN